MMTQKTEPLLRDVAISVIVSVAAAFFGRFVASELVSEQWGNVGFVAALMVAQMLIKLLMPRHSLQRLVTWPMLLVASVLLVTAAVLLSDSSILGLLTLPAVLALFALTWLAHRTLGSKREDASP